MGAPSVYLPNQFKIVNATPIVTTSGAVTFDNVSLKNVKMAWIVVDFLQAASHATTITPKLGTAVATCATAITFSAPWWKCADYSTTDALVAQTAATTMACTAGTTNQLIVIQIDPAAVAAQGDYDCLGAGIGASGEATNFVSAHYILEMKYQAATPPSAIID